MGSRYHHTYLSNFNLEKERDYLVTDKTGRTSHPRIFAIGDLKVGLNQVARSLLNIVLEEILALPLKINKL